MLRPVGVAGGLQAAGIDGWAGSILVTGGFMLCQ